MSDVKKIKDPDIKKLNNKQIRHSKMKINKIFGKFKNQEIHDSILRIRKAK